MNNEDMAICRIDYMKWSDMQQIQRLVSSVRAYANAHIEVEDCIRQVTERIEDVFEGRIGPNEYATIVRLLRGLVEFVRTHRFDENDHEVMVVTGNIIKLVQGDNKMNKNQLAAMTFRRVKEAITRVALGSDFGDDRITTVAEQYTYKIMTDVFGGKTPFEIQSSQFVEKLYEMDPETEDVLDNGTLVIDGMKVLIEAPSLRHAIYEGMTPDEISEARVTNRWATVEKSKVVDGRLSFVAVYEDGIKRKVVQQVDLAWIVKKDSIPRIDTLMTAEGHFREEMTTEKLVYFLKGRMKVIRDFDPKIFKVQTGIDGDVVPLEEYLVTEGVIPTQDGGAEEDDTEYTVWNEAGSPAIRGTIRVILNWAIALLQASGTYEGYEVGREGMMGGVSLKEFVEEHGA